MTPSPGRKFVLTLLVTTLATIALSLGWIKGGTWADVVVWVSGLYMAGNVGALAARGMTIGKGTG